MNIPFFDLSRQTELIKDQLDACTKAVFESNQFVSGEFSGRFEQDFSKYLDVRHCVSCGNATDGLELILRAMGIGSGDEVVVPAFTWISDAEAVSLVGAKPVFAEVDPLTYNLSSAHLEGVITSRTKAIIFTHLFGNTTGFKEVKEVADKFELKLIEDCAQAHGAFVCDGKVGGLGHAGVFSFYPTKNLGAYGDAGAVVTSDAILAEKVRLMANHGQIERDEHLLSGRNSRMDELQAAYLSFKLKYLDAWNKRRAEIAKAYENCLESRFSTNFSSQEGRVFHQFVIKVEGRKAFREKLTEVGVGTAVHYPNPLPYLKPYHIPSYNSRFGISRKISDEVLSLPLWPELADREVDYVIDCVNKVEI